jgi:acetyltransferase-like isoleucine patch superfamily enzyme
MELQDFLDHVDLGALIEAGSEQHRFMHDAAQEALRTVAEINTGYRTPDEVRALLTRLTGKPVDESVTVFPPFYSEFGKNLTLGKDVFVNLGCRFQDTGGITIGDGSLIGHGSTLTTLDHGIDPDRRADMVPAPVVIGRKVWLGAAVTGVPAKLIRMTGFEAFPPAGRPGR